MFNRLKNRLKFHVERLLLRGAHFRLLFIALMIGFISVGAGLILELTEDRLDDTGSAIWWAFLRLSDPGYLGDDEGMARRAISTVVTVLGYVVFLGALVAIMTQWLNQTLRKLEQGFTPIARNNHIAILGWTNRTRAIVEELMRSEDRVRRFLRYKHARGLHVVILAEDVSLERTQELRDALGDRWDPRKITFRSGTPLRVEHLERVDFHHAAAIILPGADFVYGSADASDTRIIKTLLSIAHHDLKHQEKPLPLLVTEIFDPNKIPMVQKTYRGQVEILASDVFIARCIVQNVRHPGLSRIFRELLSHGEGNEIYVRTPETFTGYAFGDLIDAYPNAILLGVVRTNGENFHPILNPDADMALTSSDRLVLLASSYDACNPPRTHSRRKEAHNRHSVAPPPVKSHRRILVLGWNHKAADVLAECDRYERETFDIDVLSLTPEAERRVDMARKGLKLHRVRVTHREGDYTSLTDLTAVDPGCYDNVVLLGSDRVETQEESDARTIVGHLMLLNALGKKPDAPEVVVELLDADNLPLLESRPGEALVTPVMVSHVLAQVALRRELHAVYEELFGPAGAEIFFRPASDYDIERQPVTFRALQDMAMRRGEIALGVRLYSDADAPPGWVYLNPPRNRVWTLSEEDELVVLTTYGSVT